MESLTLDIKVQRSRVILVMIFKLLPLKTFEEKD